MRNIYKKNQRKAKIDFQDSNLKTGFSLIELSVVIVVASIFIAGTLTAAVDISNSAKMQVTKAKMREIYRAMGGYLGAIGGLPCPAAVTDVKGDADYGSNLANGLGECFTVASPSTAVPSGVYVSTTSTNLIYGTIPTQNLKINSDLVEDGFGNKFAYIVDKRLTGYNGNGNSPNDFNEAPSSGVMTIQDKGSQTNVVTSDASFIIISYGPNGYGAYSANSASQNTRSTDSDELNNDLDGSNDFNNVIVSASDKSEIFDDIVMYKTKKEIMMDFDLMSFMTCLSDGTNSDDVMTRVDATAVTATWTETYYGQIAVSTLACDRSDSEYNGIIVYPKKKCGAFGVWNVGAIDSCQ